MREGRRRRPKVARRDLLPSEIETGTQHPGGEHHDAGDNKDNTSHEGHEEVDVGLVLGVLCALLSFRGSQFASYTALGVFGLLAREKGFNPLFDL